MDRHLYVAVLVALFIFISFILFNTFTNKGTLIGKYGAFVKFIPLFTVISVGIIGAIVSRDAGFFDKDTSDLSHPVGPFNFGLILTALPAVLFSFDGFTSAGNVSDRMENPEKEVSKTIIYSMILVGVIYILMCLGFLLSGDTDIFSFFETIFPSGENVKKILGVIISIILFMCLAISTNGFILAGVNSLKYAVNYDEIVGTTTIKRICKNNEQKTLLCYLFFVILGCLLFMGVPAILLKSDAIFDIISNTLAQIMFVLYALLAGRC
jgi:amino acid transporter